MRQHPLVPLPVRRFAAKVEGTAEPRDALLDENGWHGDKERDYTDDNRDVAPTLLREAPRLDDKKGRRARERQRPDPNERLPSEHQHLKTRRVRKEPDGSPAA